MYIVLAHWEKIWTSAGVPLVWAFTDYNSIADFLDRWIQNHPYYRNEFSSWEWDDEYGYMHIYDRSGKQSCMLEVRKVELLTPQDAESYNLEIQF